MFIPKSSLNQSFASSPSCELAPGPWQHASSVWGLAITYRRNTLRHQLRMRRTDKGNGFAFVSPVDAEIFAIHRDDAVVGVKLAHADEAKIGQIGLAVAVAARKGCELGQMVLAVESESDQSVPDHRENEGNVAQMKCCLCQNGFASQQRFGNPTGDAHSPAMVLIVPIGKANEEPGIRNAFHKRENPLRLERFFGPRTVPAKRMKAWPPLLVLAFSNWSRTSFPCDTPLLAALSSSQAARSLLRRIVIV